MYGLLLLAVVAGCARPTEVTAQPDPATPVRAYFAALAAGDTTTAYQLSRSASRWLRGEALARGYQPPAAMTITAITFVPGSNGNAAYIRATYQLGAEVHESTLEVWRTPPATGAWAITAGSTGRLDVISHTPHITVANVRVPTLLASPRISSGTPSSGFYDVPPGIYTITTEPPETCRTTRAAVPAVWRDATPVIADLTTATSRSAAAP